jgi:hypothetical protein
VSRFLIKVHHGKYGLLVDIKNPLGNTPSEGKTEESSAITEIGLNLKAKIYSIFTKLGFDSTLYDLPMEDQVTLTFVSKP